MTLLNVNHVTISGRLAQDPELRQGAGGAVSSFSIAHHVYSRKSKTEYTHWFKINVFGWLAEEVAKEFKKGDPVQVSGRLTYKEWHSQDGEKKNRSVEVNAFNVYKLHTFKRVQDPDVPGGPGGDENIPF